MSEFIEIILPDGLKIEGKKGITPEEIALSISPNLKKKAVVGKWNGMLVDLRQPLFKEGKLEIVLEGTKEALSVMRHSAAHLMAQALKRLYPNIKLGIGPVIEDGFYYDLDSDKSISVEDLPKIEKEMKRIVAENLEIKRIEVSREEALRRFTEMDDCYKLELIDAIPEGEQVSIYEQGEFFDLCRGVHVAETSKIKFFKLLNVAGAYWRGDSQNKMLQRIYGTAFFKEDELNGHLEMVEEAKKRDHRKLGKELELFMFSEEAPGMPFYLPKGQIIRHELEQFSRKMQNRNGYDEVRTPFMMNQRLWEESGHWEHYHENMYFAKVDEQNFALKPMNCPGHMLIYKQALRSYRDLPIRYSEFGQVHRHESSGSLNGMLRVRSFCQDDAHVFVRPDQMEEEIKGMIQLIDQIYRAFGFDYSIELSTRPKKAMGSDEIWGKAEAALKNVLEVSQFPYQLNEGDGAFYGPKIDFHIQDALKRSHQCGTIQLDFQMPEKFGLDFIDENNKKVRPVVIHRAIYGSIDRFIGIITEHFAGAFPTWLAPVQCKLIPVSLDVHLSYVKKVEKELKAYGLRVEIDTREEKLNYKIREAQMQKVPYTLVLGDKEAYANAVNIRKYGEKNSRIVPLKDWITHLRNEIDSQWNR
ncbi:threonine--tRNA ligase [Alkalihalobacillus sp. 1P02AB]|uniref:threonine--tRNA ligase n=1 Tax=Alkalihalobacillus sp. 1P02AB TaxID=3132260 RepID=UPI0039A4E000